MFKSKNQSRKSKNTSYTRKSIARKMKRMRDSKTLPLSPGFMVTLRSKRFNFMTDNETTLSFAIKFSTLFIFNQAFIENFIPRPYCSHLLVSSSLIFYLIQDNPILDIMHQYYHTKENRVRGQIAEKFYWDLHPDLERPGRRKSSILPFIVCTGDFYDKFEGVNRNDYELIEVKSANNEEDLIKIQNLQDQKVLLQLKIISSVYNSKFVRLVTVLTDEETQNPPNVYYEDKIEFSTDFIYENKQTLVEKYIENVLYPYFFNEFGIKFFEEEKSSFDGFFKMKVEEWTMIRNYSTKSEMMESGYVSRNHNACRRIALSKTSNNK